MVSSSYSINIQPKNKGDTLCSGGIFAGHHSIIWQFQIRIFLGTVVLLLKLRSYCIVKNP